MPESLRLSMSIWSIMIKSGVRGLALYLPILLVMWFQTSTDRRANALLLIAGLCAFAIWTSLAPIGAQVFLFREISKDLFQGWGVRIDSFRRSDLTNSQWKELMRVKSTDLKYSIGMLLLSIGLVGGTISIMAVSLTLFDLSLWAKVVCWGWTIVVAGIALILCWNALTSFLMASKDWRTLKSIAKKKQASD